MPGINHLGWLESLRQNLTNRQHLGDQGVLNRSSACKIASRVASGGGAHLSSAVDIMSSAISSAATVASRRKRANSPDSGYVGRRLPAQRIERSAINRIPQGGSDRTALPASPSARPSSAILLHPRPRSESAHGLDRS